MTSNELHNFIVPDKLVNLLDQETLYILLISGLPAKILSNSFHYYEEIQLVDNELILGDSRHLKGWKLKIKLATSEVYSEGQGENTEFGSVFINSSVSQLKACLNAYECYMKTLIKGNYLGSYQKNHESYARLMRELIQKIDPKAAEQGIWWTLIDDMDVGIL